MDSTLPQYPTSATRKSQAAQTCRMACQEASIMLSANLPSRHCTNTFGVTVAMFSALTCCPVVLGQDQGQLSQPVYRVANEATAQPATQATQVPAVAPQ